MFEDSILMAEIFSEAWDEIFSSGKHTDMAGNTHEFTNDDLDAIVRQYNSQYPEHEAPVVIGHPETDHPAYGWVEKLKRVGNKLVAKYKNLAPEFVEWVKTGRYKKKSIKLYPNNVLAHVGYLGAVPPAVKGLRNISLSGNDKNSIVIEMAEPQKNPDSNTHTSPAEPGAHFSQGGTMPIDAAVQQELDSLKTANADLSKKLTDATAQNAAFSEQLKTASAQTAQFSEQLNAVKTENANLKNLIGNMQKENQRKEFSAFCDGLIKEGKLTPAERESTIAFMESIAAAGGEIQFSENGTTVKKPALEAFKATLTSRKAVVSFNEHRDGNGNITGTAGQKIEKLIAEKIAKNKELSYASAFAQVQQENPDLAREYAEART